MASSPDSVSMALFCDFENVALGVRDAKYEKFDIKRVLERLLLKGSIVVKKAYCDWERYKSFKAAMHEANFELIEIPHVRQSGKNSADIRLVVDALDLCYTKSHVDTFVIISGDSDFSPLVSKLRENAKQVIGVGVKQSTSDLLIANCDEFIFYDDLVRDSQRAAAKREARENVPHAARRSREEERQRREELEARRGKAIDIAVETFEALLAERGESGKIWSSMLKEAIKRRKPDFNESYFGFRAFGNLLEEAQGRGLLELGRDEKSGTYVTRPGPGFVVVESEVVSREPRGRELREPVAEAPSPAEVASAAAASAVHEGRTGGRGSRRRGGKAIEAQAPGPESMPETEGTGPAGREEQPVRPPEVPAPAHAVPPDVVAASTPAESVPRPKSGRGRGRGATAKVASVPAPATATAVEPADASSERSGEGAEPAEDRGEGRKPRAGRGSARSARSSSLSASATELPEAGATRTRPAAGPVESGPELASETVEASAATPAQAGSSSGEAPSGEPTPARKASSRARRPRQPKADGAG